MLALILASQAQNRLKSMPGYARFQSMSREMTNAVKLGSLSVTWTNDSQAFEYRKEGRRYRYDIATPDRDDPAAAIDERGATPGWGASWRRPARRCNRPERPERGRQFTSATSPDGKLKAFHRERNLGSSDTNGTNGIAITSDGRDETRIKYGTANWVYGEELDQNTAIWWSSNSQKVAFYRFDESQVRDYYLSLDQTRAQSRMDIEPYMKAGATNPLVDILIYDLASQRTTKWTCAKANRSTTRWSAVTCMAFRGQPTAANCSSTARTAGRTSPDLRCRSESKQSVIVAVREEWPASWTENHPARRFLKDGRRFVWTSERTGWRNLYLYELGGKRLVTLTRHAFEVGEIVHVNEEDGFVFYTAHSGDNPLKVQLHRVGLDGKGDVRLTNPTFHHTVNMAPNGRHFIDVAQTHDTPPFTRLLDADGNTLDELATSDQSKFKRLGMKPVELLQFKAADGETDLYGMLHFPSNFRPSKKYPLLVSVYAGPGTVGARETFTMPSALTEFGFLVATFDSRSASGRGKKFMDAIYLKFGQTEVDDQAAGVKSIRERRYVDNHRVGMYGTSYGGTVSATSLLRYPEVFHAACANSAVTDYRNYDSIYTERYMWLPQENKTGYEASSVLIYATNMT